MKILFTSDLHSNISLFRSYAKLLRQKDYDVGVIAGDLTDEMILCKEDEIKKDNVMGYLSSQEHEIKEILASAGKPVLMVRGNHDLTDWPSEGNLYNIHNKRVRIGKYNFVGCQYSVSDAEVASIAGLVDGNTILVTHSAPKGILDSTYVRNPLGSRTEIRHGDNAIRRLIESDAFRLHLFGHIHAAAGRNGKFYNGSFPQLKMFMKIEI